MEKFELNTMIGVSHMQYGVDTETHVHDAIEIVYILFGKGYNIIEGEKIYIKRNIIMD